MDQYFKLCDTECRLAHGAANLLQGFTGLPSISVSGYGNSIQFVDLLGNHSI